ncbi:endonuclease/exonuclease/phosphatase family protein [Micromonospora sp. NPDC048999]|uniref:endonuclease/exonuclease/phosphatase family protein n=1 Tax=Micromonospora sp. NPDC048999 TaxID=3155391 RepID=UPI0033FB69DC
MIIFEAEVRKVINRWTRRAAYGATAAAVVASGLAAASPVAAAPVSPDAVIYEVYGGGGNANTTLKNDFITLGNRSAAPVDVTGWSVQYLPASPSGSTQWQSTPLTGEIPANGRYLIEEGSGGSGTDNLPVPDAQGIINLSATAGTVALVNTTDRLTCKTAADCEADTRIRDLIGFGTAVVRKGSPAPAPSNTTSVRRDPVLTDTGDNGADFRVGPTTPINSQGETAGDPGNAGIPTEPGDLRIHDVHGVTRISPYHNKRVAGLPGVVTGVRFFGTARGFWFQDPNPDNDPRTSEGLFVFTGSKTPAGVAIGDEVLVSGKLVESRLGGSSTDNLTIAQLEDSIWTVLSSGNALPAAEPLTATTIPDTFASTAGTNIEADELQPDKYALDFWASRESMRVRMTDTRVVGPTDAYNALWVTTKPEQNRTARGGTNYKSYTDSNTGRVKIESLIPFGERPFPMANVGDELRGVTEGPVTYSQFGGYVVEATTLGAHIKNNLQRVVARDARDWELSTATYNVQNLAPADPQAKYDRLAQGITTNLKSPDIIAVEEIQDNSGAADDGTVDPTQTLTKLTDAIAAAGGPRYEWRQINPVNNLDGGQPGGNIRQVFLFNPQRVSFVDVPGGTSTTPVDVHAGSNGRAALTASPGRIEPVDEAWTSSRKPLVGQFRFHDRDVFVIANHFNSKGGDQPTHGRIQPPARSSEIQRHKQATLVKGFIDKLVSVDPQANLVVLGDMNDFQYSQTLDILTGDGKLYNPMLALPENERYTYVYDGNSQTLDQTLVGGTLRQRVDYQIIHLNAEFADPASDHDPQVTRFLPRTGDAKVDGIEDAVYYGIGQAAGIRITNLTTDTTPQGAPSAKAWRATAQVTVTDLKGAPVGNVLVSAQWISSKNSPQGSCVTGPDGRCTLQQVFQGIDSATLRITDARHAVPPSLPYYAQYSVPTQVTLHQPNG